MRAITRHYGIIEQLKRLPSSSNGNPRYEFMCDGYRVRTAVDSSHGYAITNFEGKQVEITIGSHYGVTTLNTLHAIKQIKINKIEAWRNHAW